MCNIYIYIYIGIGYTLYMFDVNMLKFTERVKVLSLPETIKEKWTF